MSTPVRVYVKPEWFGPYCYDMPGKFSHYLFEILNENKYSITGRFTCIYTDMDKKQLALAKPCISGSITKSMIERIENE